MIITSLLLMKCQPRFLLTLWAAKIYLCKASRCGCFCCVIMCFAYFYMFISLLAQRNEPKKVQPLTWSRKRDYPAQLAKCGRFGKSHPLRGTSPNRFSAHCCAAWLREMAFRNLLWLVCCGALSVPPNKKAAYIRRLFYVIMIEICSIFQPQPLKLF